MAKKYFDIKIEEETYKRFRRIKKLMEFNNDCDYSISVFVDILLDNIGSELPFQLDRIDSKSTK